MKALHLIAFILVVIGGLNWLVIGVTGLDFVMYLGPTAARIIYILVGISTVYLIFTHKKACRDCVGNSDSTNTPPAAM